MIQDIEKYSEEEMEKQAEYLMNTPVSEIVQYLRNGQLKLFKAV